MRAVLNRLYQASGLLAALCIVAIAAMIVVQILSRFLGVYVPATDEFAAALLAASAFLGLAYALRNGAHIRVRLLIARLPGNRRRAVELFCLVVGTALTGAMAYYMVLDSYYAWKLNDYTGVSIPIPKWTLLAPMALGAVVLLIAFADDLVCALRGGQASYMPFEEAEDRIGHHE
ncbi:MAG: TRAP transporter small permease [Burkholderiales bacterium]|nr:MAG: TRAP transporter small permease [Burkholderiales bacterium]